MYIKYYCFFIIMDLDTIRKRIESFYKQRQIEILKIFVSAHFQFLNFPSDINIFTNYVKTKIESVPLGENEFDRV